MTTATRPAVRETALTIPALDGFPLAASRFGAEGIETGRVILVSPATGVRRGIYRRLAGFLAGRGAVVVTWDWRGTGESRPESLRGFAASLRTWAEQDLGGVLRWARDSHPGAKVALIGHSFGGQALGLLPEAAHLDAAVTLAAQSGYLGHWPWRLRLPLIGLWYAVMPALAYLFGYFPSRRLGFGEDLPRDVALEWAGWCRRPEFVGDWSGHRRFKVPVLGFSFDDDPIAPRRAVDALHAEFGGAVTRRHLTPGELGVRRLGHFEFLRPGLAPALWSEIADWLDVHAA
jgi:predicted alpha/beta hydrolase